MTDKDLPEEFLTFYHKRLAPVIKKIDVNDVSKNELDQILIAESKLPLANEFEVFNDIFSRYVTLFLKYTKETTKKNQMMTNKLKKIGTSILEAKTHPKQFKYKLNDIEDKMNPLLENKKPKKVPETSGWGVICKEIISED